MEIWPLKYFGFCFYSPWKFGSIGSLYLSMIDQHFPWWILFMGKQTTNWSLANWQKQTYHDELFMWIDLSHSAFVTIGDEGQQENTWNVMMQRIKEHFKNFVSGGLFPKPRTAPTDQIPRLPYLFIVQSRMFGTWSKNYYWLKCGIARMCQLLVWRKSNKQPFVTFQMDLDLIRLHGGSEHKFQMFLSFNGELHSLKVYDSPTLALCSGFKVNESVPLFSTCSYSLHTYKGFWQRI
jgi:hypothetical protein